MPAAYRRLLADLALVGVATVWGVTFPVAKWILETVPPFWYLAVRFAVASCALMPFVWTELRRLRPGIWMRGVLAGLALAAGYVLQTLALLTSPAANAAFITGLFVVLTPLLATLVGHRPTRWEWVGVGLGTAGLTLLTGGVAGMGKAEVLLVGCAVCFAVHILLVNIAASRILPLALGGLQVIAVTVVMAGLAAAEAPPRGVGWEVWAAVAAMGLVASAAAFAVQSWAQRFTPPTHVGLVFTVEPIAAAVGAWWGLGEVLTLRQAAGAVLILAGIVVAQMNTRRITAEGTEEEHVRP